MADIRQLVVAVVLPQRSADVSPGSSSCLPPGSPHYDSNRSDGNQLRAQGWWAHVDKAAGGRQGSNGVVGASAGQPRDGETGPDVGEIRGCNGHEATAGTGREGPDGTFNGKIASLTCEASNGYCHANGGCNLFFVESALRV